MNSRYGKQNSQRKTNSAFDGAGFVSHFKADFVKELWQFVIWKVVHAKLE